MKTETTHRKTRRTGEFRLSMVLGAVGLAAYLFALGSVFCMLFLERINLAAEMVISIPIALVCLGLVVNFGGFVTACLAFGTEPDRKLGCLVPLGLNVVPPFLAFCVVMPPPPI